MSSKDVLINIVCPLLGAFISNAMFFSPWPLVMKARRNRHLGSVNPVPFAVMFNTQLGYTIYGAMLSNYYIFFSAVFGVLLALFYCITCLTIMAKEAVEDEFSQLYLAIEGLVLGGIGLWSLLCIVQTSIFAAFPDPHYEGSQLIGTMCCFFNVCYYASPLSTMAEVVRKRDASSLYLPNILVNSLNATLWLLYGAFGVHNVVVWGPSFIGLCLSLLQISLVLFYHDGHWFEAVSGWITHRTILKKTRVAEEDLHEFTDSEKLMATRSRSRKMTFVVTPEDSNPL